MKKIFILVTLFAMSCAQKTEQSDQSDSTPANVQDLSQLPSNDLYSDGSSELIKTAELRFQVSDLKNSREQIDLAIRKYSGFIASSDLKYENPVLEEHLTIRVLSIAFEPLLREIEHQAAYVNFRKVTSDDVEKEFVDLESRLKSKREMEQRYADIVRSKAKSMEELLKAEREIGKLHEEIEAVVSRINFLRDQVRHSTIKLEIYQIMEQQTLSMVNSKGLGSKFLRAFTTGWQGLTSVFVGIVYVWPIAVFGVPISYFLWFRRRRKIIDQSVS
jgi:hypothetical protein